MKYPRFELTGVVERPSWWLVRPEEIKNICQNTVKGKCSCEALTPAGLEVFQVVYNDYEHTGNKLNWISAVGCPHPEIFGRKGDQPQTVLLCGGIHGCEAEGTVLLLNLISLLETGLDLRGKERPRLLELCEKFRLVLFPCVNMDGRAISPDHRLNADVEECRRAGGGWWKNGETIRWPGIKEYFPLPLSEVGYPGGYPNSEGYNIQLDGAPGNIKTREAAALLRAAGEKCVDLFVNLHSQPEGPGPGLMAPSVVNPPQVIEVEKELVLRCGRAMHAQLGYPWDESGGVMTSVRLDINNCVTFASGAPTLTIEFPARLGKSFDNLLETGYLYLETILSYGTEKLFCDRAKWKAK
ncbi:MAG: hypothetical protein IKC65_05185 [Lentisphaeria bacterium]|nr:hypothetical protein [Lentisphaeria bacterium]